MYIFIYLSVSALGLTGDYSYLLFRQGITLNKQACLSLSLSLFLLLSLSLSLFFSFSLSYTLAGLVGGADKDKRSEIRFPLLT